MRYFISSAFIALATVLLPATATAKECVAWVTGALQTSAGLSAPTWINSYPDPQVFSLDPGDAVVIGTGSNGIQECGMDGRFKIFKNGMVVTDLPFTWMDWEHEVTFTEPGFYTCEIVGGGYFLGITLLNYPRFFITTADNALISLSVKAWLEGAYVQSTGLMHDQLRAAGVVPLTNSYGPSTTAAVLSTTGPNAIVDWVTVEIRTGYSATEPITGHSGLLQRDGDVVDVDGVSPLVFFIPPGNYHVLIHHRNHLSAMTATAVALTTSTSVVDFRSASLATYGIDARRSIGSQRALWAGETSAWSFQKQVSYTGSANDRDPILLKVGSTTPNASVSGYFKEDVNLDGVVKYTGSGNDRDFVLTTVGSTTPNGLRQEQLP